jgi:hypothetical protein
MVVILAVLVGCSGTVQAFLFTDPTGLYSTQIGDRWVYQAHQSTSELMVFYGAGDFELLYFERLGPVGYATALEFAQRSIELYGGPGGLEQFELVRDFAAVEVAGVQGISCAYAYQDGYGNRLWEYRIFLVLPTGEGFSIAFSDHSPEVAEGPPPLEDILRHWRWLL